MPFQRKTTNARLVTIEITGSQLRFVSIEPAAGDAKQGVRTSSVTWRHESSTLHSEVGVKELTAGLKTLASREKLNGKTVRIALSGDFCVTRVLSGTAEHVRRELAELEDRSQRYLSLGPGRKALAGSMQQVDARHQHALLSVSNQKTLDAIGAAASAAGVEIELVEPSLVALCRVVGRLGHDAGQPTLVASLDEKGVELGISYDGKLLLDYRPGGRSVHDDVADIVTQHLGRLKRYCYRYFQFAQGDIKRIYLCGDAAFVGRLKEAFATHPELDADVLDLARLDMHWNFVDGPPDSQLASAIGTCLIAQGSEPRRSGPNLMEEIQAQAATRLAPAVLRLAWPIAAALLVAAGFLGLVVEESVKNRHLENQVQALATDQARARELRLELARLEAKQSHLTQIARRLEGPTLDRMLTHVAGCLPDDVWLNDLKIEGDGEVKIRGGSFGEDGVYEFVRWLGQTPGLDDVALEEARPGQFQSGWAIDFLVACKLKPCDAKTEEQP